MDLGYVSKAAAKLAEEIFLKSGDLWAKKILASEEGVVDVAVPAAATFTPAVSPGWGVDAFVGKEFLIDNKIYTVVSNTADAITWDSTEGGQSILAGTFAARVMDVERFLGYSQGKNFGVADEKIEFTDGVPSEVIREDLVARVLTMTGQLRNSANFSLWQTVFNLKDVSDVTHYIGRGGTNPTPRERFEFIIKTQSVETPTPKAMQLKTFLGEISQEGEVGVDEEGYKVLGFTIKGYKDPVRTTTAVIQDENLFEVKIEK